MQSIDGQEARAQCDGILTDDDFLIYVATSDYMSKRNKLRCILIIVSIFCIVIYPALWVICGPSGYILVLELIIVWAIPVIIIALVKKQPAFWGTDYQTNVLLKMYSEALGLKPDDSDRRFRFQIVGDTLSFTTFRREIAAPLQEVRWVRQVGDLVIVGCLYVSRALVSPLNMRKDEDHYKPVPAAAFFKSKLEGMDSDELIALLEEYAKMPKPPLARKGNCR